MSIVPLVAVLPQTRVGNALMHPIAKDYRCLTNVTMVGNVPLRFEDICSGVR